jgi:hypothetical protein
MLGDSVQRALSLVGVTEQRVKALLGDCCCEERKAKLNALDAWARRVLRGNLKEAEAWLVRLMR